jgi:hypothetical protein
MSSIHRRDTKRENPEFSWIVGRVLVDGADAEGVRDDRRARLCWQKFQS